MGGLVDSTTTLSPYPPLLRQPFFPGRIKTPILHDISSREFRREKIGGFSSISLMWFVFSYFFLYFPCVDMRRGRVQLKRIENKINRQVTFSKRRSGLLKKAHEISVLCDAQVAVVVFSTDGKFYEYSTDPGIEIILERYERHFYYKEDLAGENLQSERNWSIEHLKLKSKVELLHKSQKNLMGEDLDSLTPRELHNLEQQLECGLKRIRTQKNIIIYDSIADLQTKEKMLQKENHALEKKLKNEKAALAREAEENHHHNSKTVGSLAQEPLLNLNLGYTF